ncbi:MAG: rhomboid family intramembrane serine protease [Candidatus Aenigmarchaeota archaeon]|nr:rhomboid family intramembrane serine protease [Candidatus Aenigmarchaeota archaeon]NIP40389.1 rhomboid family intramembrane serine protease [Candidatus Aenigmarchaeota archaeon]NIQ18315.1 rhomboid family intramembrane serine protease [Candidatus Aenigmarchaeota archaeon]NIS73267.1 rhomboid family intramembrane serine protease [Candidatus Aenigmarchaeota archaeon]
MGRLTWILIILNVVIFELVFSMPESLMDTAFNLLAFSSPQIFEVWRLFTSLFVHASASHLFFNMLGLYFFGRVVEEELNPRRFLLLYFIAGLAGSLVYGLTSANPVVGASGCVFGLMGYAMIMKPKKMIKLYVFPLPLGIIAIIFAIIESILVYYGEVISGVAHIAHVAGMFTGIASAFLVDTKRAAKCSLWLVLFVVILVLLGPVFGLIIGIGNLLLGAIDFVVGIVLYGLAKLIGVILW